MEAEFELALRSGVRARTLDGLLRHFDLESVTAAYRRGDLEKWLRSGGNREQADHVRSLDPASPSLKARLCRALGLDSLSSAQFVLGLNDPEESSARAGRLAKVTDDPDVLDSLDCVAFSQEDLDNLAFLHLSQIFLCGERFTIPASHANVLYVGLGEPLVQFTEEFVSPGVDCINVRFDTTGYVRDFICWISLEDYGNYYFSQFWDNLELGVKILEQAADEDDPRAQTLLSMCLRERYGVSAVSAEPEPLMLDARSTLFRASQSGEIRNNAEAARWALWAAGQGDPAGMCMLGNQCFYGLGVPEDRQKAERLYKDAFHLFREGAEGGDAASQMNLAWCWFYGVGTERSEQVAMQWLKSAAELGLACAQCELADAYMEGELLERDQKAAFEWYGRAASQGDARGLAHLADFYYFGDVVPAHEPKAVRLYNMAAAKGSQHAQKRLVECYTYGFGTQVDPGAASFWLGKLLDQQQRFRYKYGWTGKTEPVDVRAENKRNFRQIRRRARQGDLDALCDLAWEHILGCSTKPSYPQARDLFRRGIQRGHAPSMYGLGRMYELGQGCEADDAKAARCYRNAASHGDVPSQVRLASWYAQGRGVPEDQEKATYWYRQAAEEGYSFAEFVMGQRCAYGRGVERNLRQAASWYEKAAEQGEPRAQCSLALMYLEGSGVEQSASEAAYWFKKAARQGNASAQLYLGMLYAQGNGVEQSAAKAARWYALAAEKGDTTAQNNLGYCYFNGDGVEQDFQKAVGWYERSASQDDLWAMTSLAYCYYNGTGVDQNTQTALYWFRKAAELGSQEAQAALEDLEL